jgi:hypothetical protein
MGNSEREVNQLLRLDGDDPLERGLETVRRGTRALNAVRSAVTTLVMYVIPSSAVKKYGSAAVEGLPMTLATRPSKR